MVALGAASRVTCRHCRHVAELPIVRSSTNRSAAIRPVISVLLQRARTLRDVRDGRAEDVRRRSEIYRKLKAGEG